MKYTIDTIPDGAGFPFHTPDELAMILITLRQLGYVVNVNYKYETDGLPIDLDRSIYYLVWNKDKRHWEMDVERSEALLLQLINPVNFNQLTHFKKGLALLLEECPDVEFDASFERDCNFYEVSVTVNDGNCDGVDNSVRETRQQLIDKLKEE